MGNCNSSINKYNYLVFNMQINPARFMDTINQDMIQNNRYDYKKQDFKGCYMKDGNKHYHLKGFIDFTNFINKDEFGLYSVMVHNGNEWIGVRALYDIHHLDMNLDFEFQKYIPVKSVYQTKLSKEFNVQIVFRHNPILNKKDISEIIPTFTKEFTDFITESILPDKFEKWNHRLFIVSKENSPTLPLSGVEYDDRTKEQRKEENKSLTWNNIEQDQKTLNPELLLITTVEEKISIVPVQVVKPKYTVKMKNKTKTISNQQTLENQV